MDLNSIEHAGRVARENGKAQMENPYFSPENMPKSTGESAADWQAKIEAWERGWSNGGVVRGGAFLSALA